MNIVFYAKVCGMGNNGGSRTIFKSAMALENIGHRVDVIATADNFTWFSHKKVISKVPTGTDVVIAVSANDVERMHEEVTGIRKAWWIRGWELWQMSESQLFKRVFMNQRNICNSGWLCGKLKERGVKSALIYSGLDVADWVNRRYKHPSKVTIGSLYSPSHKTKRWDLCMNLHKTLGTSKYEYLAFGAVEKRFSGWDYTQSPRHEILNLLYNSCDIWFAPTELEGFHNVPAEAGLCGSLIVANSDRSGGMLDYCNEDTAMMFGNISEAVAAIKDPDFSRVDRMRELLKSKVGSREVNMKLMVEELSR